MIAPDQAWPYLAKGVTYWSWRGRSEESRKAFELVPSEHNWYPWVWYWQLVYEQNYREALDFLSSVPGAWISIKIAARPVALLEAYAYEALDQPERAAAAYETAKDLLEIKVSENPSDPRYHGSLGIAYAALGKKEDAVREGKRAVELLPVSKDAVYGLPYVIDLAHIYSLLGDNENALVRIEEMLANPSSISAPLLLIDPRWSRLRDNPEFQTLVKKYSSAES
jgi:tetratricopeptide (TPR) repeat protein